MKTGALQPPPLRQLMRPLPYSPPKTNAAFLTDGMTITHVARSQSSFGTSLSGAAWISVRTAAASSARSLSFPDTAADNTAVAASDTAQAVHRARLITSILQRAPLFPDLAEGDDDVH